MRIIGGRPVLFRPGTPVRTATRCKLRCDAMLDDFTPQDASRDNSSACINSHLPAHYCTGGQVTPTGAEQRPDFTGNSGVPQERCNGAASSRPYQDGRGGREADRGRAGGPAGSPGGCDTIGHIAGRRVAPAHMPRRVGVVLSILPRPPAGTARTKGLNHVRRNAARRPA